MPTTVDLMFRLLVALVLGLVIGLEREQQERAAGLRTVTMVSLGSCLFTLVGAYGFGAASRTDPTRVAAQIVTGIGFLGAGTIFLRKDYVRGLTTAATIWTTAAVGMAAGAARYFEAVFVTLLILAVLMVLKPVERRFFRRPAEAAVSLVVPRGESEVEKIRHALSGVALALTSIRIQELPDQLDRFELQIALPANRTTADLLRELRTIEGVQNILLSRDLVADRIRAAHDVAG